MKKFTQTQIKHLIQSGILKDLNAIPEADRPARLDTVGMSFGTYGMNGAILVDENTGTAYGIAARSSTLFRYC